MFNQIVWVFTSSLQLSHLIQRKPSPSAQMSTIKTQLPTQNSSNPDQQSQSKIEDAQINKKQNITSSQNIFSSLPQDGKPKSSSIFNQANQERKTFNIFTQKNQGEEKKNIFEAQTKSVNLFNISTVPQTANPNIFKSASKPLIKTLDEDDDKSSSNASSSMVTKAQSEFKTRPLELVMKFNYENPWTVIKTFNLKKFKNGANSSKQFIYLTFQKHSEQLDKIHIFVRARQTKVLLFQGFGVKGISDKISTFMNREDNLKFYVIKQGKKQNEEEKAQLVKEELKVQFESVEDANDFKEFMVKEYGEQINKSESNEQPI